ncbi:HU family DNA-binding protein [bacterium]|nr:HU family DNA-binding protein [bacterium]
MKRLQHRNGISEEVARLILHTLYSELKDALVRGEEVRLHGVCALRVSERWMRLRHPKTGYVTVAKRNVLVVRPLSALRAELREESPWINSESSSNSPQEK